MPRTFNFFACMLCLQLLLASAAGAADYLVPSSQCRGLFIVPVSWQGITLDLILDTGSEITAIDPDAYQRVTGRKVKSGRKVRLKSGEAGPLKINKIKVRLHEMDHLGLTLGRRIDGILGMNVFHKFLLTLDYPNEEIRVGTGVLPKADGVEIFQDVGKTRPYIMVDLGGRPVPVLIDSGFTGSLDLRGSDSTNWKVEPVPYTAVARYSEIVIHRAGRIARNIQFGPLTLVEPVVFVSKGTRLAGAKLLKEFTLVFDHRNNRLQMTRQDNGSLEFDSLYSWGLGLRPRLAGMELIKVFTGSPAEKAGLKTGDILTAVDGVPIHERGCKGLNDGGSTQSAIFTINRDGTRLEVKLTVEVVIP